MSWWKWRNCHHHQQWLLILLGRKVGLCSHTGFPNNEPVYDIPYVRAELPFSAGPMTVLQSGLCPMGSTCEAAEGAGKHPTALMCWARTRGSTHPPDRCFEHPFMLLWTTMLGADFSEPCPFASTGVLNTQQWRLKALPLAFLLQRNIKMSASNEVAQSTLRGNNNLFVD